MNFFSSMDAASSAMTAERFSMDVISQNIANANTENTAAGTPYRRQSAVIESAGENSGRPFALPACLDDDGGSREPAVQGVKVEGVVQDNSNFRYVYDPTNPNAIRSGKRKGYVAMPNVNLITEMTDMIAASRAYEANATVVDTAKAIATKGMDIGTNH